MRYLPLILLLITSVACANEGCTSSERVSDAFTVLNREYADSNAALLRPDMKLPIGESIEKLASTLKNAKVPIVVDDRDRKGFWLEQIREFESYPALVPPSSLADSRLFIFVPLISEDLYLHEAEYSGLHLVFLEGTCQ